MCTIDNLEIEKCFFLSIPTQILDTLSKRHAIINFVEFAEALFRIAAKQKGEKSNLPFQVNSISNSPRNSPHRTPGNLLKRATINSESPSLTKDMSQVHLKFERLIWRISDLVDDPNIEVNKTTIFETVPDSPESNIGSPTSPRRTVISPMRNPIVGNSSIIQRSRSFEPEPIKPLKPILRLKSKFNQLVQMKNLPLE